MTTDWVVKKIYSNSILKIEIDLLQSFTAPVKESMKNNYCFGRESFLIRFFRKNLDLEYEFTTDQFRSKI
jgi:hypothetical protein